LDCVVKNTRIDSGASFCQVDRMVHDVHEIDNITEGYQKWHGTLPILRRREITRIDDINLGKVECGDHNIVDEVRSRAEPNACARKYFTDPSIS
jgi:hypothetical protein